MAEHANSFFYVTKQKQERYTGKETLADGVSDSSFIPLWKPHMPQRTDAHEANSNENQSSSGHCADTVIILIDFENVAKLGCRNVIKIVDRIAQNERVGLIKAYANWRPLHKQKQILANRGVTIQDMPINYFGKNSADMQLAADAMDFAYTNPALTKLVIISGDRDFVPMIQKVRAKGKLVWAYGPKDASSKVLSKVCDHFEVIAPPAAATNTSTVDLSRVRELNDQFVASAAQALQNAFEFQLENYLPPRKDEVLMSSFISRIKHVISGFKIEDWVAGNKRRYILLTEALQRKGLVGIRFCPEKLQHWITRGPRFEQYLSMDLEMSVEQ